MNLNKSLPLSQPQVPCLKNQKVGLVCDLKTETETGVGECWGGHADVVRETLQGSSCLLLLSPEPVFSLQRAWHSKVSWASSADPWPGQDLPSLAPMHGLPPPAGLSLHLGSLCAWLPLSHCLFPPAVLPPKLCLFFRLGHK